MMMLLPLNIWATLDTVRHTVVNGKIGAISSVCIVIAGILAAVSILKVSADYIEGQGSDVWKIVRPLVLLAIVANFEGCVLSPVNSIVNVFSRDLAKNVEISFSDYFSQWSENIKTLHNADAERNEEEKVRELEEIADQGPVARFFCSIWIGVKKALMNALSVVSLGIGSLVGGVIFLLAEILTFVQMVLSDVYLAILALVGPIVFSLAILDGYSSGIRSWLARYIQISMWIPLCYLMLYINLKISTVFCSMSVSGESGLGSEWLMVALQAVSLISVASVPKLAGMIIESTGDNGARSSFSQPARMLARKFIKF